MANVTGLRPERLTTLQAPRNTKLDIIAIRSLKLSAQNSWYSTLLPHDFPSARIAVWGYNASSLASKAQINSRALELLRAIIGTKDSLTDRDQPIIFVAHGLGGLVLKQALIIARSSGVRSLENIIELTIAVMFLGTPFQLPKNKETQLELGSNVPISVNSQKFVEVSSYLKSDAKFFSSMWESQQIAFSSIWRQQRDIKIISFVAESLPRSSDSNYYANLPYHHYVEIPLQRDHLGLWRSTSPDASYRLLSAEFQKLLQSDVVVSTHALLRSNVTFTSTASLNPRIRNYLDHLKLDDGRAKVPAPAPGTLSWVARNPKFASWTKEKTSNWLWIRGKPGSGKSTLAKHLVDRGVEHCFGDDRIMISYFFDYTHRGQSSLLGFFRTSLYQLFIQIKCARCRERLQDVVLKEIDNRATQDWLEDLDILSRQLQLLMSETVPKHRLVFVIDGLDECDEQGAASVVTFLREQARKSNSDAGLCICITSRYDSLLVDGENQVFVDSENDNDILEYISLQAQGCKRDCPHLQAQKLAGEILGRARGVFLWVRLVLTSLNEAFAQGENVLELLCTLPSDLSDLYKWILFRNDLEFSAYNASVMDVLRLVLVAMRPLSVIELYSLVSLTSKSESKLQDNILKKGMLENLHTRALVFGNHLRSKCSRLLLVSSDDGWSVVPSRSHGITEYSQVRLIHRTLQEFLLNECLVPDEGSQTSVFNSRGHLHLEMAGQLLDYLDTTIFRLEAELLKIPDLTSKLPFLGYATAYWTEHIRAAEQEHTMQATFDKFWSKASKIRLSTWHKLKEAIPLSLPKWNLAEDATTLHWSCHNNLQKTCRAILKLGQHVPEFRSQANASDVQGRTPLLVACENGSWGIAQDLIAAGVDVTTTDSVRGQSPLHWASFAGKTQVTMKLIAAGADVNDHRNGTTPLTLCAAQGYVETVRILLECGANPLLSDLQRGQSALSLAILNRHYDVVCLLCDHGSNINEQDLYSNFVPLQHAIMSRSPKIVAKLLEKGAHLAPEKTKQDSSRLEMWLDRLARALPLQAEQMEATPSRQCAQRGHARSQSTQQCREAPQSCSRPGTSNTAKTYLEEDRKRSRDESDDESELTTKTRKIQDTDDNLYACPYFKFDPINNARCASKGYRKIDRLKDHLRQTHRISRCTRCGSIQASEDLLATHKIQEPACLVTDKVNWDFAAGYDEDQARGIALRHRNRPNSEKWIRIYKVLFPLVDENSVPDPLVHSGTAAQVLQDYDAYRHQQHSPIVSAIQSLMSRGGSAQDVLNLVYESDAQTREQFLQHRRAHPAQAIRNPDQISARVQAAPTVHPAQIPNLFVPTRIQGDPHDAGGEQVARNSQYLATSFEPPPPVDSGFGSNSTQIGLQEPHNDIHEWEGFENYDFGWASFAPNISASNVTWPAMATAQPMSVQLGQPVNSHQQENYSPTNPATTGQAASQALPQQQQYRQQQYQQYTHPHA